VDYGPLPPLRYQPHTNMKTIMKQISLICDVCLRETGDNIPATKTAPLRLPGVEPIRFDLCEQHTTQYRTLMALVSGLIVPIQPGTQPGHLRQAEPWKCPICRTTVRRGGAVLHLYRHTPERRIPLQPTECPTCGSHHPDPRGMSRHRANLHKWDGYKEALKAARKHRLPLSEVGGQLNARTKAASRSARAKRMTPK
jgi:hypothetical protein